MDSTWLEAWKGDPDEATLTVVIRNYRVTADGTRERIDPPGGSRRSSGKGVEVIRPPADEETTDG